MSRIDRWVGELGYREVPGALLSNTDSIPPDHPFDTEVQAMFDVADDAGASAVLCIDRVPTVCLVDATRLEGRKEEQSRQIRGFCERLWNQNLARIVLVAGDEVLEAWSVDDPKGVREIISASDSDAIRDFSFRGLLSGEILRNRQNWFDPGKRVDKTLLDSIGILIEKLSAHVAANIAREITASVIFVAYLEDRSIVTEAYRTRRGVSALYDLLRAADAVGIKRLFDQLQKDFNGDFLAAEGHSEGVWEQLPGTAFEDLFQFLRRTVLRSGQGDLWRYDFAYIPIELIAGIYETFLGQKAETETPNESGASAKRAQGAYYTPRLLADWVVEQAFEGCNPLEQTIFDGACGSGMLLTAAFRRLMRAQRSQARTEDGSESANNFAKRCSLLLGHIFGSDIDEDARRLTAFSLYLALLSDLAPRDLELLRQGGHKLPALKNNIRSKDYGNFFSEKSEAANKNKFTIFLSNPPWRKLRPADWQTAIVDAWAMRQPQAIHLPKRQIAAAFALAAADTLKASGRVALILPIGLFTSVDKGARRFRANLLTRYKINRITNFADMRRLIFVDADHPFVVMIATRRADAPQELSTEEFEYWTPKTDISLSLGRLTLHGADRTVMRVTALIDETPHLSLRYWGTQQDVALVDRLRQYGTVNDLCVSYGWKKGKGFHLVDNDRRIPEDRWSVEPSKWLKTHKFLEAKLIPSDLPIVDEHCLKDFPFESIARESDEVRSYFEGPRVIWPDGTHPENGVKAVFADAPFSFQHSVAVLSAPKNAAGRLEARFLTAYMRSSLGTWLSLLLSPSVAAERPKLHLKELLAWPYWPLARHPQTEKADAIAKEVDRIFSVIEDESPILQPAKYEESREELEALVFDYFGLRSSERVLVRELATYAGPSLQPGSLRYDMLVKSMRKPPTRDEIDHYCKRLIDVLVGWRDATGGKGELQASARNAQSFPFGLVTVTLSKTKQQKTERRDDDSIIGEWLSTITSAMGSNPERLLTVPDVIAVKDNKITIIKPLVTRFWLERAAIEDANKLVAEIRAIRRSKSAA